LRGRRLVAASAAQIRVQEPVDTMRCARSLPIEGKPTALSLNRRSMGGAGRDFEDLRVARPLLERRCGGNHMKRSLIALLLLVGACAGTAQYGNTLEQVSSVKPAPAPLVVENDGGGAPNIWAAR
jgi:hypothetical protein